MALDLKLLELTNKKYKIGRPTVQNFKTPRIFKG